MSDVATYAFLAQLEREASAPVVAVRSGTKEAYRWGRIDERSQSFQPFHRSGNSAIIESNDLMGRRVRDEAINVAQVKKIIEAFQDLIIGCGMQTFADPLDASVSVASLKAGKFENELNHALEADEYYDEWFNDPKRFNARRKLAGPEFQRLALKECATAGSVIILECFKKNPDGEVELCYQMIERDQLDLSKDRPAGQNQNKIVNGIEFDADDVEIAFHILDAHPYDNYGNYLGSSRSQRIEAERVFHLVLFGRPTDTIGVNWVHAIGQNQFDRDSFLGSELQTAARAARMLLVAKFKNIRAGAAGLGLDDANEAADAYGNLALKLGASPHAFAIGTDDDIELIETNRPNSNAAEFIRLLDHDTAGGAGLSSFTVTGDYSQSNFTSVRGALLAEDAHIRPLQNWFARDLAIPMRKRHQRLSILGRKLKTVSVAQYMANRRKYERFEAIGAGRELLDPSAETEAALGKLRGCLSTLKLECARRGLHWIRVLRQAAWENSVANLFGVVLDFTKGQGSATSSTTREANADQRKAG